jgi:hypothetical protein
VLAAQFAPANARAADWSASVQDPATGVVNPASGAVTPGTAQSVNFTPFSNRRMIQAALRADVDITDNLTLTSQTSYADFNQQQRTDGDGSPL